MPELKSTRCELSTVTLVRLAAMNSRPHILFFFVLSSTLLISASDATTVAYPLVNGGEQSCGLAGGDLVAPRREVYGNGRIYDITHRYHPDMPAFETDEGIGQFLWLLRSKKNGSIANNSEMKMPTHTGTHVDAPGHFYDHYFDAGFDVDTLDLEVLNGPALLIDVPRDSNITAKVLKSLHIPKGVCRVLFRTLNTDRRLMFKKEFDSTYVAFTKDGAQWLADNTDIKLVGVDYMSAASYEDLASAHYAFLKSGEIILVEALKLDDVPAGIYDVHCLPLRLMGAEGSPIRCILMK